MIPPDLKDAASSVSLKNLAQELIHFIQVLHTLRVMETVTAVDESCGSAVENQSPINLVDV
jgi:hypothetical protein